MSKILTTITLRITFSQKLFDFYLRRPESKILFAGLHHGGAPCYLLERDQAQQNCGRSRTSLILGWLPPSTLPTSSEYAGWDKIVSATANGLTILRFAPADSQWRDGLSETYAICWKSSIKHLHSRWKVNYVELEALLK